MTRLNFDVLYYIASILDLATLQLWRATCKAADRAGAAFLRNRYHRLLRAHFVDANGFRSVLRATGSVISGSAALHVLDSARAEHWQPRDIDLYVPLDHAERVATYITEVEEYVHLETHESWATYTHDSAGFVEVSKYENGDGMRVDLIKSATHSSLYPIPFFWSTHVMNYLTADSFCMAYPSLTLQGRGLMNPVALVDSRYPHKRTLAVMTKYHRRGYDFRLHSYAWDADPSATCARGGDEGCPRTIRYFGDPYCLTGTISTIEEAARFNESRAQPDSELLVRWWRGGHACGGDCAHTSEFSVRAIPHASTHRITRGFYDSFVNGRPVREAIAGPLKV